MKVNKVVKLTVYAYLTIYVVMPITITICKIINNKFNTSEKIKEFRKDFDLKQQGIITVNYRDAQD